MTHRLRSAVRVTSEVVSETFKKAMLIILVVAVLASVFTTSLIILIYRIAQ